MTTQGSHKHLVIGKAPQSCLPTGNLISTLHPHLHHLLVQNLSIPMLLPSNTLTPLQQRIELQGTKTTQVEIRVLLQLEQTQGVCKTKKMEEHQNQGSMRSAQRVVITNVSEVQREQINKKPYMEALIENKVGTLGSRVPTHAEVREEATAAAS